VGLDSCHPCHFLTPPVLFVLESRFALCAIMPPARACTRIGKVLKLKPMDIEGRSAIIRGPKSGREDELVFLSHKVADRLTLLEQLG